MSHYKHLCIKEREKLYLMLNQGISIRKIAIALNWSASTISREIQRNQFFKPCSSSIAQRRYQNRLRNCGRKRILPVTAIQEKVRELIQYKHWSPKQVSFRLKLEQNPIPISYATIYRRIAAGIFDPKPSSYLKKKTDSLSFSEEKAKYPEGMAKNAKEAALKFLIRLPSIQKKQRIDP